MVGLGGGTLAGVILLYVVGSQGSKHYDQAKEQYDTAAAEVTVFENGLWNKISPAELENELRALPNLARQKAGEAGLQKEAFDAFTTRVRDKFAPEYQVEVKVAQPLD